LGGDRAVGDAWKVLRITGMLERLLVAASACGLARAATQRASAFIKERRQFGQTLNSFQSIQHAVVDMSTLTTAMEAMVAHAVRVYESGANAGEAISKAKLFCSESVMRIVESALRVMGGRAYFDFEVVSRYYREAPFSLFAGGTSEIQKMLIARSLGI
jgi:alkylation response protein AidB-like acyl-CoA dehydrogenase